MAISARVQHQGGSGKVDSTRQHKPGSGKVQSRVQRQSGNGNGNVDSSVGNHGTKPGSGGKSRIHSSRMGK